MFSSKSESYATDARSMASDRGIAGGGSSGIIGYDLFVDKIMNTGKSVSGWKISALAAVAVLAWQTPPVKKLFRSLKKK